MENVKMNFEDKMNQLKKTLINKLSDVEKVYIVPHVNMDFDAIASASALYEICKSYGKEVYIVTDDLYDVMEASFRIMYKELTEKYNFITTKKLENIRTDRELVIMTDTNKKNLIPIKNIDSYNNIIIIDHHKTDNNTVETDDIFIETEISSASEIVFNLIKKFNINIDEYLAHGLLAGIYLDTNRLSRNFKSSTSRAVTELMELGANSDDVNNLFVIANFDSDRRQRKLIDRLIDSAKFDMYNIAITMNETEENAIYCSEDLAKAADYLLQYAIDAAFVVGFIDKEELGEGHKNLVAVKARSKTKKDTLTIDVCEVMKLFNGGGDVNRAACIIETDNIKGVVEALHYIMRPGTNMIEQTEEKNKVLSLLPKDKL